RPSLTGHSGSLAFRSGSRRFSDSSHPHSTAPETGGSMSFDLIAAVHGRPFRRWIEGAGLSLEANTPSTPTTDVYYVLQGGVVCFSSADLSEAGEVFDRLRVGHWEGLLASRDPQQRLDGARGLFRHDHLH